MCDHYLSSLPCLNAEPHPGDGHGCVHDAGDTIGRHGEEQADD